MTGIMQRAWVWLSRISHCRGFGIQSPTDYSFVRYVVNEHWPYYAYDELRPADKWLRRKLGRLYLRLANHVQPAQVADLVGVAEYLHAGCRKASIGPLTPCAQPDLIIAPPTTHIPTLLKACATHTTLVVEDIGHHRDAWQQVLADERVTAAFDLYYCGIASFYPRRTRSHYKINF